jgi:hypothetical protein
MESCRTFPSRSWRSPCPQWRTDTEQPVWSVQVEFQRVADEVVAEFETFLNKQLEEQLDIIP